MKVLYLDCGMGAAGDMLTAALLELHPRPEDFIAEMNALGLPEVSVSADKASKCGIVGTRVSVKIAGREEHEYVHAQEHDCEYASVHAHEHTHEHRSLSNIYGLIDSLQLPEPVKDSTKNVYKIIADAESRVHGRPAADVHFHEVGALDALADIAAVCRLIYELKPDRIIASPVNTGSGTVKCAHGILPVPAPATALILKNIPIYSNNIQSELCTPTGAALLAALADGFGPMPALRIEKIGYGMGNKDFAQANCVRAFWGESGESALADVRRDQICELACNVEDMTGEEIGFAINALMAAGAVDVSAVPVTTKKSRPGFIIYVLCRPELKEKLVEAIFKHTSTLGVREKLQERYILKREIKTADTPYGPILVKASEGCGIRRCKYEYDDLAAAAEKHGLSLQEIKAELSLSI